MARRLEYRRYTDEFKATAVALSRVGGVQSKDVAEALDIHPLMLSRWRKEYREGKILAKSKKMELDGKQVAELRRLKKLEREHNMLKEEHALLKKAIQFSLERKKRSLSS
jgi:transposase-like protein